MYNKIAVSLFVAVFAAVALLSTADTLVESAAAALSTYSEEEIERYQETVEEGEGNIMNCVSIIICLVVGFALGRLGSNICDGVFVLGGRPEDNQIKLAMGDDELARCQVIMLRVVNKE